MRKIFKIIIATVIAVASLRIPAYAYTEFEDINHNDWYYYAVTYCRNTGIMDGVDESHFSPDTYITRAQLVVMLYSLSGKPECDCKIEFSDVPDKCWYSKAVAWAVGKEITAGTGKKTFSPNYVITREQAYTMIYKYWQSELKVFQHDYMKYCWYVDCDNISKWAKVAIGWATENNMMSGYYDEMHHLYCKPKKSLTRAEAAAIMRSASIMRQEYLILI